MRYVIPVVLVVSAFAAVVPSAAQVPGDVVRVDPNGAGDASHQILDLRASDDPQARGESPEQAFIDVAAGARFDSLARKETCSPERAKGFDCPGDSKIGSGSAQATLTSNGGIFSPQPVQAAIELFLAPPQQSGDLAAIVVQFVERSTGQRGTTTGRVVRVGAPYGLGLRLENLRSAAEAPEGFRIRVDRIRADMGAFLNRKKTAYKYVRKNGKKTRVKYKKKVRHDLLRNPKTCDGAWEYRVRLVYPGGRESVRDAAMPCTK
jgi:hypothetical protein